MRRALNKLFIFLRHTRACPDDKIGYKISHREGAYFTVVNLIAPASLAVTLPLIQSGLMKTPKRATPSLSLDKYVNSVALFMYKSICNLYIQPITSAYGLASIRDR